MAGDTLVWDSMGATWTATAPVVVTGPTGPGAVMSGSNAGDMLRWDSMYSTWVATGVAPIKNEDTTSYPNFYQWQLSTGVAGWQSSAFHFDGTYFVANSTIPTSSSGLPAGAIYNDSGTLKIA
jgi:hypothetical protein